MFHIIYGMKRKKPYKFILDTDWIFNGYLDVEHRQYVLLDYFKKISKHLEEFKIYPMFIELSLHLGNIQTLLKEDKILYIENKITSPDYEVVPSDLKVKDIPILDNDELEAYNTILKLSNDLILDHFNFAKSLWTVVYNSIDLKLIHNKNNLNSKSGFFYFKKDGIIRVWKYTTRRVNQTKDQTRTSLKLIYENQISDLTIKEIIFKFSKTYEKNGEGKLPVFEMFCENDYPLDETLVPFFKRKLMGFIAQSKLKENYRNLLT
jgi:hypothetical protein